MSYSWMLRRLAPVRSDVSEESRTFIIKVTIIGELGTTLAVTSNRRIVNNYLESGFRVLVTANILPN
jgi:hypothetical protein